MQLRAKTKFLKPERSSGHRNVVPAERSYALPKLMRAKTPFLHNFVFATALAQRSSVTKRSFVRQNKFWLQKRSFCNARISFVRRALRTKTLYLLCARASLLCINLK